MKKKAAGKKKTGVRKKVAKKTVKKSSKKALKKTVIKSKKIEILGKPIGKVTHFYGNIKVAVIKFKVPFKTGTAVKIKGATSDFVDKFVSMQYDHKPVKLAKKNQAVGVKVKKKTREGDLVYLSK